VEVVVKDFAPAMDFVSVPLFVMTTICAQLMHAIPLLTVLVALTLQSFATTITSVLLQLVFQPLDACTLPSLAFLRMHVTMPLAIPLLDVLSHQ
jgi:hypothetical protein